MSEPDTNYADLADMFRHLNTLDEGSVAYRRQRDSIIERCLPLADHIAHRYRGRGQPADDLVQVARLGLVNAVNRFDFGMGEDFLSFAVPTMMGEVRRHFRDYGWAVKVPRRCKDLQGRLTRARNELSQQLQRAPNASELAARLGVDRELVVDATIAGSSYSTLSSDVPSGPNDDLSIANTLGGIDPHIEKVLDVETVRPMITALPERERTILMMRFFEEMTQTQIAEQMGISQMHVSRLLAAALNKLRSKVRQPELAATG